MATECLQCTWYKSQLTVAKSNLTMAALAAEEAPRGTKEKEAIGLLRLAHLVHNFWMEGAADHEEAMKLEMEELPW